MKLRCENLVKKYGVRTVVKGVSMEVNQGEIVAWGWALDPGLTSPGTCLLAEELG